MKRMFRTCALLAALLLAAAALAGCAAQDERVAARVGDREITMQLFKNAYLNSLTYASIYYDLTTDEGVEAYQDDVINSLIQTEMLLYQAEQAGVTLSEEEEAEAVAGRPTTIRSTTAFWSRRSRPARPTCAPMPTSCSPIRS